MDVQQPRSGDVVVGRIECAWSPFALACRESWVSHLISAPLVRRPAPATLGDPDDAADRMRVPCSRRYEARGLLARKGS